MHELVHAQRGMRTMSSTALFERRLLPPCHGPSQVLDLLMAGTEGEALGHAANKTSRLVVERIDGSDLRLLHVPQNLVSVPHAGSGQGGQVMDQVARKVVQGGLTLEHCARSFSSTFATFDADTPSKRQPVHDEDAVIGCKPFDDPLLVRDRCLRLPVACYSEAEPALEGPSIPGTPFSLLLKHFHEPVQSVVPTKDGRGRPQSRADSWAPA